MAVHPKISAWLVAAICILYYIDPYDLLGPSILACAVHEAAHLLCAKWLGLPVIQFELTLLGARLQIQSPANRALLLCTLAGPLANFLLCGVTIHLWPRFAWMNLVLGLFNCLPYRALDGGQILQLLLCSEAHFQRTQLVLFLLTVLCCIALTASGCGIWPCIVAAVLLIRGGLETAVAKWMESS